MNTTNKPQDLDTKISELLNIIQIQRQELTKMEQETRQPWKTNCSFPMVNTVVANVNIQTANEDLCVEVQAELLIKLHYYVQAAEMLDAEYKGKWNNYSLSDWHHDLKKRIAIIKLNSKRAKLDELEKKLNTLVSPEQRRLIELDNITKSLGL
ncbi:MAG: hypothetical protein ACXW2E_00545 [Nitrososphaeraceae archaeon]